MHENIRNAVAAQLDGALGGSVDDVSFAALVDDAVGEFVARWEGVGAV